MKSYAELEDRIREKNDLLMLYAEYGTPEEVAYVFEWRAKLSVALQRYGSHDNGCAAIFSVESACNCGLMAALKET